MIVENIDLCDITALPRLLDLNQDLADERRDSVNRRWHGQKAGRGEPTVRHKRLDAVTNSPDFHRLTRESLELVGGTLEEHLVEAANQALVGTEEDGAHGHATPQTSALCQRLRRGRPKTCRDRKFHGPVVAIERLNCLFVLTDARGRQRLHGANHSLQVIRTGYFPA